MAQTHDITTYGRRLVPHVIDERARKGYLQPFALFPKSKNLAEGFRYISYACISNAINQVCWWLETQLPNDEEDSTFAYFGSNDLRYVIFLMASIKTRKKVLIASPRNTIAAQMSLFERTGCKYIVLCRSLSESFRPLFAASSTIKKIEAPDLDTLLEVVLVPHYDYDGTFENDSKRTICTLHTSGSSGNPKPINWNQTWLAALDTGNILPENQGIPLTREFFHRERLLELLPCFHGGGLGTTLFTTFYEMTLVLGHPEVPLSPQYVAELLKQDVITAMLSPPSILEDLASDPVALLNLAELKHVGYAGGPLQPDIGGKLSSQLPHIFSFIGATEYGWFHEISCRSQTWDSVRFFSDIGYHLDEISEGIFELVILNDERTNKYHGVFEVFSNLSEYRTKDLYSKTIEAPGLWKYRGRSDDLIVLSNGEKINPIPLENIIRSHPLIKGALIVGEYRFSPSLLLETETSVEEERGLLEDIWPKVVEANRIAPGFSKISKSLIMFTKPEKPFLRAGKGTIQRQLTVKAYQNELDKLYSSQESDLLLEGLSLGPSNSLDMIRVFTKEIFSQALEKSDLEDSDDVFQNGMDSLRVIIVVQRIRAAMESCKFPNDRKDINVHLVYSNPSVDKMTKSLVNLISKETNESHLDQVCSESREKRLQSIIEKYIGDIPTPSKHNPAPKRKTSEPWSIILTGTTGSLGSYLLAVFEAMPMTQVAKIFCLNRSPNAMERQKKLDLASQRSAKWHNGEDDRVEFLQTDLSKPNFGLAQETYDYLSQQATLVVHSAWQVDFNLTVESFEPQIRGVKNLLDFCYYSTHQTPLVFISSISTATRWPELHDGTNVPEDLISDFEAPERIGYGESKFISEHLLDKYSKRLGVPTVVLRTGQIAGPIHGTGVWNPREWFPSMLASSKHLGFLPASLGKFDHIDWLPVDILADIVAELVCETIGHNTPGAAMVYNVVNPTASKWSELIASVQESIGIKQVVPLKDWVQALEESSREKNGTLVEANPGVKLLDFFRLLSYDGPSKFSGYELDQLLRDSDHASNVTSVRKEWISIWIQQWGF